MAAANEATPLRDLDNGGGNGSGEDGDGYNRNPVGATEADLKGGSSRRQVVASSDGVPVNLRAALFFSLEGDYGRIGRIVESGVCVLILAAVIILCLQSGNGLRHKVNNFSYFGISFLGVVFCIEYVIRVLCCTMADEYSDAAVMGRVRYATTPLMAVDAVAVILFLVGAFGKREALLFVGPSLRAFRLLRVFTWWDSFERERVAMGFVFRRSWRAVVQVFVVAALVLVVGAGVLYYTERATSVDITSMGAAAEHVAMVLTAQGTGDLVVSPAGQVVISILGYAAILTFALPTAVLAANWLQYFKETPYDNFGF